MQTSVGKCSYKDICVFSNTRLVESAGNHSLILMHNRLVFLEFLYYNLRVFSNTKLLLFSVDSWNKK